VALAELEHPATAASIAFENIGYLRADVDPEEFAGDVLRVRIYAGYAGWAPGQLEAELEEDAWILEPAQPEDVFTADADGLWSAVLRRKGGQFKLIATMPPNPELN
jgi:putative transcriptional regulator